jgi:membrane protein
MKLKTIWSVLRGTVDEFMEDRALRLSAALAYYSIFSIAPLLIIVIAVAGFFMGEQAVRDQVQQQLQYFMGEKGATAITSMIGAQKQGTNVLASIVGVVALLFGASGVFGQLQDSLNVIWEVQPKPGGGIWGFIRARFLSFAMILGIGFLLLISMVISMVLSALTGMLPMPGFMAQAVNFAASFIVITLLFTLIFKVLPDAKVRWRDVWIGAVFTALLFTVGKHLLGLYLGQASTTSSFGAAGSLVLVLLWVYYSSLILFLGAEFTQVYAKATGSRIVPADYAVPVTEGARAEQGMPSEEQVQAAIKEQDSKAWAEPAWRSRRIETKPRKRWPYLGVGLGLGVVAGWFLKRDLRGERAPAR